MSRTAFATILAATLAAPLSAHANQIAMPMVSAAPHPNAGNCKLQYGGGPLLQQVKVVDVFYNTGNPYRDKLNSYYQAITQSGYFDWLTEYNAGSYKISRGSFAGFYEDNKSTTQQISLDDSQIGPYLDGLISAGHIPAPDDNTIYQIYFPSNVSISLQGSQSCVVFCAYHNSYMHGSQIARYSVIPDVTSGGCAQGCGGGQPFDNLTDVSSHELIEAVTDPDNNSAWVDQTQGCGEIGDICNGKACTTTPTSTTPKTSVCPTSYVVQLEWSNAKGACIAQDPAIVVNDWTIAASPTTVNVPVGGTATATVTLTKTTGNADNVTFSATAPTGLTVAFSPASATSAGGTSMATFTAAANATVGSSQKVTLKGASASGSPSHTVDVTVQIVAPPDMAMAPDLAQPSGGGGNGGSGGGGNGGSGGGPGTGGNGGNGGSGGGNGNHGGDSGCSIGGGSIVGSWAFAGLVLLALAFRRRRA